MSEAPPQGTDTRVRLYRNDGSEVFNMKASRVETEISNGLVTDSIISGVSRAVVGGKYVLDLRTFQIDFEVQGMKPEDYPNSGTYEDDDYGYRWELERAALTWGWTFQDGFDILEYDGRDLQGVITNLSFEENTESKPARNYTGTLEWTYLNSFIS